jgi:hypothetical protein
VAKRRFAVRWKYGDTLTGIISGSDSRSVSMTTASRLRMSHSQTVRTRNFRAESASVVFLRASS